MWEWSHHVMGEDHYLYICTYLYDFYMYEYVFIYIYIYIIHIYLHIPIVGYGTSREQCPACSKALLHQLPGPRPHILKMRFATPPGQTHLAPWAGSCPGMDRAPGADNSYTAYDTAYDTAYMNIYIYACIYNS